MADNRSNVWRSWILAPHTVSLIASTPICSDSMSSQAVCNVSDRYRRLFRLRTPADPADARNRISVRRVLRAGFVVRPEFPRPVRVAGSRTNRDCRLRSSAPSRSVRPGTIDPHTRKRAWRSGYSTVSRRCSWFTSRQATGANCAELIRVVRRAGPLFAPRIVRRSARLGVDAILPWRRRRAITSASRRTANCCFGGDNTDFESHSPRIARLIPDVGEIDLGIGARRKGLQFAAPGGTQRCIWKRLPNELRHLRVASF
jgi:hypothetical protein